VLKHYVHAIADLAGSDGHLDLDLADRARERVSAQHRALPLLLGRGDSQQDRGLLDS